MDWFGFLCLIEVTIGGRLSGVLYARVAIGFVLIYKTSGVLNFAQGAMVLFAALTFVSLVEAGVPFIFARIISAATMVALGFEIERTALRPRANRSPMTLFMATLGLSNAPFQVAGVFISTFDLVAAAIAGVLVASLTAFFRWTRTGLALRAVADDQFAALAVGLRSDRTWATVWAAAGIVALVAGQLWRARIPSKAM